MQMVAAMLDLTATPLDSSLSEKNTLLCNTLLDSDVYKEHAQSIIANLSKMIALPPADTVSQSRHSFFSTSALKKDLTTKEDAAVLQQKHHRSVKPTQIYP